MLVVNTRSSGYVVRLSALLAIVFCALAASVALSAPAYAEHGNADGVSSSLQAGDALLLAQSDTVYLARSGKSKIYHLDPGCSNMKNPKAVSLSSLSGDYRLCKICENRHGSSGGSVGGGSASSGSTAVAVVPADDPYDNSSAVWYRHYGSMALDTMSAIVNAGGFERGGAVVLATADGYWDALTAAGIAGMVGAPVLMTDGKSLSSQTRSQLESLMPATVIVCGGPAAVSDSVAEMAASVAGGAKLVRCSGFDAVHTALDIYGQAPGVTGGAWARTAFVCTNDGYWDALAAAPISYARHMPIFLTDGSDSISADVLNEMKGSIDQVYIVGGTMAVSAKVESAIRNAGIDVAGRFAGQNAVETSEKVALHGVEVQQMSLNNMGVATTGGYWDALSGAAFCGKMDSVLILADGPDADSIAVVVGWNRDEIECGHVFGGPNAVSHKTFNRLAQLSG